MTSLGMLWSNLLLMSATVERFISIAFALKVKSWNLLFISKILMIVHLVVYICLSAAWVHTLEFFTFNDSKACKVDIKYLKLILIWIHTFLQFLEMLFVVVSF